VSANKLDDLKAKIKSGNKPSETHAQLLSTDTPAPRKRTPKPKFEETHTRKTFWIRNDLAAMVDEEIQAERGAMTAIINELLDDYFKRNR
jgi:hypothetical protein